MPSQLGSRKREITQNESCVTLLGDLLVGNMQFNIALAVSTFISLTLNELKWLAEM
jgi:hypothetical protein